MAFRRRFRRGRRRFRRGRRLRGGVWRRRGLLNTRYSIADIARGAWRGVKFVKGLVNAESKKHDFQISDATIPNTGTVSHLSSIAQGSGIGQRDGNSIYLRHFLTRFSIRVDSESSSAVQICRLILFIDTQQIADTLPTVGDVLDATGGISVYSPLNDLTVGRFTILIDRTYSLHLDTFPLIATAKWRRTFRHHIRYNGNAGSDQQKGALYLLRISDVATNPPRMTGMFRLTYHDN